MEALVIYSLKVAACLTVFCLFFKLLLARQTFHRLNRLLLLGGVALSFVLPVCVVTIYRELPALASFAAPVAMPAVTAEPAAEPFAWGRLAAWVFAAGAAVSLLMTLRSLGGVLRLVRRGRREQLANGSVLVHTREAVVPFSWGRYIVVPEEDLSGNGREILLHEQAHVRLRHSADLLLLDLAGCLQWFNPAMWLLRRELRAIHEYEADREVLRSGVDARQYQLLLVRKAVGGTAYSVANRFTHSKLKNRIAMMTCKKSSRWAGARALLVLPLAALGVGAFAETAYLFPKIETAPADSLSKPSISLRSVVVKAPMVIVDGIEQASPAALDSLAAARIASVEVIKDSAAVQVYGQKGRNGVIVVKTRRPGRTEADSLEWSLVKVGAMLGDTVGRRSVTVRSSRRGTKPAIWVNGVRVDDLDAGVMPQNVQSVTVYKGENIPEELWLEGSDASISITTKKGPRSINSMVRINKLRDSISLDAARQAQQAIESARRGIESMRRALEEARAQMSASEWERALEKVEETRRWFEENREKLMRESSEPSVSSVSSEPSGSRIVSGAGGVSTGEGKAVAERDEESSTSIYKGTVTLTECPDVGLILINGERATKADVERIAPKKIKRMEVYKGEDAIRKFGEEGRDGVLVIRARK